MRLSTAFLVALLAIWPGCSDEISDDGSESGADVGFRDRSSSTSEDLLDDGGEDRQDGIALDTTDTPTADHLNGDDSAGETDTGSASPGPTNPSLGCTTHGECPDSGTDPGVCCSAPLRYESVCSTLSACGPGGRDGCVSDDQCPSRTGPDGERRNWTVCCHDRGAGVSLNFCAGDSSACQRVIECETPSDCATAPESATCCSYHDFYQRNTCTSAFFALNPSDCL